MNNVLRAVAIVLLGGMPCNIHAQTNHAASPNYRKLRTDRATNLARRDGLLSIVARETIVPGDTTIGSALDNKIIVPGMAPHLGVLHMTQSRDVTLAIAGSEMGKGVMISKVPVVSSWDLHLSTDMEWLPWGDFHFGEIPSKETLAVRLLVKYKKSEAVNNFPGLRWFPPASQFRVKAHWIPEHDGMPMTVSFSGGSIHPEPIAGYAEFILHGKKCRLAATVDDDQLFFVIGDKTNSRESYGGGRFLYASDPDRGRSQEGTLVLDFNQLTNPYCSYSIGQNCPRPTRDNTLPFAITAGEKKFSAEPM